MKNLLVVIMISILIVGCKNQKQKEEDKKHEHNDSIETIEASKKKPLSPHTSTMAMIGDAHVHIDYSSPGVRGRIIFGGLVGYNNVWQAGAHKATWIETNKDLIIDGKTIVAGKYGLFAIPSKDDWILIINKNWDQHGKDEYDEKEDVVRVNITPTILENSIEHLEYKIDKINETEGEISLAWEKIKVRFSFKIKK